MLLLPLSSLCSLNIQLSKERERERERKRERERESTEELDLTTLSNFYMYEKFVFLESSSIIKQGGGLQSFMPLISI